MRGTATTGWGILIVALVAAVLLVMGMYAWDSNGRATELALRPTPVAPPVAAGQSTTVVGGSPSGGAAGDASAGQKVFVVQCNGCHPGASAGIGPAVRGPQLAQRYPDDGSLATVIRQGVGNMRPFLPDQLNDGDLANVVAYLRRL